MDFSVKAYRPIMSRSWRDLCDDSPDVVSPCDEIKNVMLDLPNADDVSNASVSVAEASVSVTPEYVCYRMKRNLPITQNKLFA